MTTVLSIMDRGEWGANTDNIVVADPESRSLLWVPRDLWCERFGNRINRVFAHDRHAGLIEQLGDHGIAVDHSLCVRREALERALAQLDVTVPVSERLEFWYPLQPTAPIEAGRKRIVFEPPQERLAGERIHQWIGARYEPEDRRAPLLHSGDYARMRRQQVLLRRLLEDGFDFASLLADPDLVTASSGEAIEELARVDRGWRFSVLDDVRNAIRDEMMVLERSDPPAASVIVLSYNSRDRIDRPLASLRAQRLDRPYEVIVVDSGDDGCADYVLDAYPEVRVVHSQSRLWPGAARNRGIDASRGDCIAFLSDDCEARPDWLRRRVELHRRGFELVGGAVVNRNPRHPVASAAHYLEYSALMPSERILRRQRVPHSASYARELVSRAGPFPEDTRTGEDTLYNQRCLRAGATVAFDPDAQIAHDNATAVRPYLRHHYVHGRGLVHCMARHRFDSPAKGGVLETFVRYPAVRWASALARVARGRPRALPAFLALTPLIWSGLLATSIGAWSEWRRAPTPVSRRGGTADGGEPAISVVVCSYRSRQRIDHALGSLRRQDLEEPFEVIVVDSGGDDASARYVREAYPEVRLVRSERRLYPAAARNAGVKAARGRFVAFLPDDGIAEPDWLRRRLGRHRRGHAAVGGAITNGTPRHPVGTASYFVEYSALLPSERVLREQQIPHCLSYERALLQRLGGFPEERETGEDTILNARLADQGVSVALDPEIRLAHVNLTSIPAYLRHLYEHGYGFGLAGGDYGSPSVWMARSGNLRAAARIWIRYPVGRWWTALGRIARGRRRSLPAYLALTPLVWAGLGAAAAGRWAGWRARDATAARRPEALPG